MKKLIATWGGAYRNYDDAVVDVVSEVTKKHEDKEILRQRAHMGRLWVRLATNRIAFRHDEKRGPISATLPGAVY